MQQTRLENGESKLTKCCLHIVRINNHFQRVPASESNIYATSGIIGNTQRYFRLNKLNTFLKSLRRVDKYLLYGGKTQLLMGVPASRAIFLNF